MSGIRNSRLKDNNKFNDSGTVDFKDVALNKVEVKLSIDYPGKDGEVCRSNFYFDDLLVYTYMNDNYRIAASEAQNILNKLITHPIDLRFSLSLIGSNVKYNGELFKVKFWRPDTGLLHIINAEHWNYDEAETIEIDFLSDSLSW